MYTNLLRQDIRPVVVALGNQLVAVLHSPAAAVPGSLQAAPRTLAADHSLVAGEEAVHSPVVQEAAGRMLAVHTLAARIPVVQEVAARIPAAQEVADHSPVAAADRSKTF